MKPRSRAVISRKQLAKELQHENDIDDGLTADVEAERPKTRAECPETRPCPWVGCRHHLALEATEYGGVLPPLDDWETRETCALDVADRKQEPTLEEIGELLGITRERVRQIEERALAKLNREVVE